MQDKSVAGDAGAASSAGDPEPKTADAVVARLAADLKLDPSAVERALDRLDAGLAIPYLARYCSGQVGGLDEPALRAIRDAAAQVRELEARRTFVLHAVEERGDVSEKTRRRLQRARTRAELEDLYLPFRPRRRTRGSMAEEQGLGPLADALLDPKTESPETPAAAYVDAERGVADAEAALRGARDILAERFAEDPEIRSLFQRLVNKEGKLQALPPPGETEIPKRYSKFTGYEERIGRIPSHRFLALRRAEKEGALANRIQYDESKVLEEIERRSFAEERPEEVRAQLRAAAGDALRRIIAPAVLTEVRRQAKVRADRDAIRVFTRNLHDLLMSPPAGPRRVLGIDPARRGAVHLACVDERGTPVAHERIKPFSKDGPTAAAAVEKVRALCRTHNIEVVALGNGPGSHECEVFLADALEEMGEESPPVAVVDEAGVGAYASGPAGRGELGRFPVPVRGAISLARRLMDPLAELVKVDPKQIGVGQYQNDVEQMQLRRELRSVVESSVNSVGVDLNRATRHQLAYVCGLNPQRGQAIVERREKKGLFRTRAELAELGALPPDALRQAAGFVRVYGGENLLDATGVHPDHYPVVERIAAARGVTPGELVGTADQLADVAVEDFADEQHPPTTVASVLAELLEGGLDPRPPLEIVRRRLLVRSLEELKPGMRADGRVTNVTAFGAFVDIGVGQDGLIHVSELSDRFVKDPSRVVHVGQVVSVRVLSVDMQTRRVALSMKPAGGGERGERGEWPG